MDWVSGILGTSAPSQPGVGGAAPDPARLVRDPTTGYYFDPGTGTSYTDQSGSSPVADPNVAQQVAANYQRQQQLLQQLPQYQQAVKTAMGAQGSLAQNLNGVVAGTAPSAAQVQLQQGLDQLSAQQLGAASAVGGNNAFAAQRNAMNNIAGMGIQDAQAQALVRAQESAAARAQLGSVLSQQAAEGTGMYGQVSGLAQNYGQMAASGQAGQQGLSATSTNQNAKTNEDELKGAASGIGSAVTTAAAA